MNLVAIIRSIEELLVEVVLWFILIPKTLVKLVFSPGWISEYVADELIRPADEQFDEYVSPVTLWLVMVVVPYFWALTPLVQLLPMQLLPGDNKEQIFLVALFLAVGPLGFATALLAHQRKRVTKSGLKPLFYEQCYCFTPAFLFCLPIVFSFGRLERKVLEEHLYLIVALIGASFAWLFVAEVVLLHRKLQMSWIRAGLFFFPIFFASYMVAWTSGSLLLLILLAASK